MFIDARTLPNGTVLETTMCILGSGPAGVTLAKELMSHSFDVCVLESGGFDLDASTQNLYENQTTGDFFNITGTRLRQFGGTSNGWSVQLQPDLTGVRYMPMDEIDFESRDYLPHSGWPITKQSLIPFYERAQIMCKAGPYAYQSEAWTDDKSPAFNFKEGKLISEVFQFGHKTAFQQDIKAEFKAADNLKVYLYANVVEVETSENGSTATQVRVVTLEGNQFSVSAKIFIIATGGIESARLLLASTSTIPNGIGNEHDLVGRYFMDHPVVYGGRVFPYDPNIFRNTDFYDLRCIRNTFVMGKIGLSKKAMIQNKLMNTSAVLFPRVSVEQNEAHNSLHSLVNYARKGRLPDETVKHLSKVINNIGYLAASAYIRAIKGMQATGFDFSRGGWSKLSTHDRKRFVSFELLQQTEQAPDPDNRVTLQAERDQLGMPKIALHWKWGESTIESVRKSQILMKEEFAASGIGDFQIATENDKPALWYPGTHHHMGTTRMHTNPKQGVVNEDCRIHGVNNLYIASSSVFPTGGYANPTLTIVALAMRIADHVTQELRIERMKKLGTITH